MRKIFLLLTIIATSLQAQNKTTQSEIKVSAIGKATVIPDIVTISFGIETRGDDSEKAKKENDIMVGRVLTKMKNSNISQKDLKTKWFSLYPRHENKEDKTYYVANQNLEITLRDISQYEKVMNQLVETGVNRFDQISYGSSQIEKLKSQARKLAVKEAEKKAKDLADAVGRKVGKVILISDEMQDIYGYDYQNVGFSEMSMTDSDMVGKKPNIGEMEIKATVNVTFLLE